MDWRRIQLNRRDSEPFFVTVLLAAAVIFLVLHTFFPALGIDLTTVALLGLILIIYYFPTIKEGTLPGGISFKRELERTESLVETAKETTRKDSDQVILVPPRMAAKVKEITISQSPTAAIVNLAIDIEKLLKRLYRGAVGKDVSPMSLAQYNRELFKRKIITENEYNALSSFIRVRNIVVHEGEGRLDREDLARTITIGLNLLSMLERRYAEPRVHHR